VDRRLDPSNGKRRLEIISAFPASPTTSNKARSRRPGPRTSPGKPGRNRSEKARIARSCDTGRTAESHVELSGRGHSRLEDFRAAIDREIKIALAIGEDCMRALVNPDGAETI